MATDKANTQGPPPPGPPPLPDPPEQVGGGEENEEGEEKDGNGKPTAKKEEFDVGLPQDLKERLTSRKFLAGVALHVISIALLLTGFIDPVNWTQFNLAVYGVYSVSNAASKFAGGDKRDPQVGGVMSK
jgi:hypothetical protein